MSGICRKIIFICFFGITATHGFAESEKSGWIILNKAESINIKGITSISVIQNNLLGALLNPAILGMVSKRELYIVSELGFVGDKLGGIFYGEPFKNSMLSGGFVYYDAGPIELTWIENEDFVNQEVSLQKDIMGILSYGYGCRNKFYLGASLKAAKSEIAERQSANAYACDAGIVVLPYVDLTVSMAFLNFGNASKFFAKTDPLPSSAYFGVNYLFMKDKFYLLPGVMVYYKFIEKKMITEANLNWGSEFLYFNLKYDFNPADESINFGIGTKINIIEILYSYSPNPYLDAVHRINIGYAFGVLKQNKQAQSNKYMKNSKLAKLNSR